jgi:hypothetical protein
MSSKVPQAVNVQRRNVLKYGSLALVAIGAVAGTRRVHAQGLPMVDPKDPTAMALGYVADAAKADKAKFPKFAAGQHCGNCSLFQGKTTDASGPCPIFAGKAVSSKGWCSAYVKKA